MHLSAATHQASRCYGEFLIGYIYICLQRGSVHSYVPAALEPLVCRRMEHHDSRPSYWEQRSLVGLTTYVDILKNIVNPYLNSRSGFLALMLLNYKYFIFINNCIA